MFAALTHAPDGSGLPLAAMVVFHAGTPEEAERELAPFKEWGPPIVAEVGPMPYPVMNTLLDGAFPPDALNYWLSSFTSGLPDGLIDAAAERFATNPSPMTPIILEHFHGAVTRVGDTETAVPHREKGWNLLIPAIWLDPAESEENIAWARETHAAFAPHLSDRRWLNYLGDDQGEDSIRAAYGPNWDRLVEVKRRYDPRNVFRAKPQHRPVAGVAAAAEQGGKATRVLAGAGSQLLNIVREAVNRLLGVPGLVSNLLGFGGRKRLRVCVVVLSAPAPGDETVGRPLATEHRIRDALKIADEVFRREANTELVWGEWPKIRTIEAPAPAYALDVECGAGSWLEDLGGAGGFFRGQLSAAESGLASSARAVAGYGRPISVFVVRDIAGKGGCSLGPLSDYATVDQVRGHLIAHELGHSCGLWHSKAVGNLMLPSADSEAMTRVQQAIFRNSRHVTFR